MRDLCEAAGCQRQAIAANPSFLQRVEISNDVLPVGLARKIDEHFGPVNKPRGICEILVQVGVVPGDVRLFHSRGEIKAGYGTALASDDAGEGGSDFILPSLCRVTNGAVSGKDGLADGSVAAEGHRRTTQ